MMRLVFLFCAEERELMLLGDPTLRPTTTPSPRSRPNFGKPPTSTAKRFWSAGTTPGSGCLATFRAVYGGVQHDRLKLPAYGGNLFNPDRFPFLEGRKPGTSWQDTPSRPAAGQQSHGVAPARMRCNTLNNAGWGQAESRRLSFRALDIEQIGHVYEGLLDHTAKRATEPVLGLLGTKDKEPEIPLAELEQLQAKGEDDLSSS